MKLTESDLKYMGIKPKEIKLYLPYLNQYLTEFRINTPDRILCFLANVFHESANLFYVKEIASGVAYEGRKDLGNTKPGDGVKFKGRSAIQITGRFNYNSFTEWCKKRYKDFKHDFVKNPELLETPEFAILGAFWFWERNGLEVWADAGKFKEVCAIINTGSPNSLRINGMEDRLKKYKIINNWLKTLL
jgi:putative chitinase